jgi:hypothetical protein
LERPNGNSTNPSATRPLQFVKPSEQ